MISMKCSIVQKVQKFSVQCTGDFMFIRGLFRMSCNVSASIRYVLKNGRDH